jgi:NhaP-type Na+/H+ and K+/H+ antiporter
VNGHKVVESFVQSFALRMGLGMAAGLLGGFLIAEIVNQNTREEAPYPILMMLCAL